MRTEWKKEWSRIEKKMRWGKRMASRKNSREGGWKRRMTSDLDKGWTTNLVIASVQDKNNSFVQQQQGSWQCSRTASSLHCSAQHIPSTLPDLPLSLCSVAKLSVLSQSLWLWLGNCRMMDLNRKSILIQEKQETRARFESNSISVPWFLYFLWTKGM